MRFINMYDFIIESPRGQRHNRLFKAACSLGKQAAESQEAFNQVHTFLYEAALETGLTDKADIDRHINRGIQYGSRGTTGGQSSLSKAIDKELIIKPTTGKFTGTMWQGLTNVFGVFFNMTLT